MPYVVKGDIDVRLPSTIDSQGVVHYDTFNVEIENQFATYSSVNYTNSFRNINYTLGAYNNTLGFYQAQVKLNLAF